MQKLNRAQEEASLDLGATYWQTFWRYRPNLKSPSSRGAPDLHFSMDEIAVSFFLIGRTTPPLEIWEAAARITRNHAFDHHLYVLAGRLCSGMPANAGRK